MQRQPDGRSTCFTRVAFEQRRNVRENEAEKSKAFEKQTKPWAQLKSQMAEVKNVESVPGITGHPAPAVVPEVQQPSPEAPKLPEPIRPSPEEKVQPSSGTVELRSLRRVIAGHAVLAYQQHFSEVEIRKALEVIRDGLS